MAMKLKFRVGENGERTAEVEVTGRVIASVYDFSVSADGLSRCENLFRQRDGRYMVHIEETRPVAFETKGEVVFGLTLTQLRERFPALFADGARRYGLGGRPRMVKRNIEDWPGEASPI